MSNIVFCFDGTCNEPQDYHDVFNDESITNIVKIHLLCGGQLDNAHHQFSSQKSFYYAGIGTYGGWLQRTINSIFAPSFLDVDTILNQAHEDFSQYHKPDDQIYVFGFSRGAALARIFAAKLAHKGIEVQFLGVFDTVASIGMPTINKEKHLASDVVFENGLLNKHILKAVHCVALDEQRIAFRPTLISQSPQLEEIWFAGVHSDIGGGFWQDGLSDITLDFMLKRAQSHQLKVLSPSQIDFKLMTQDEGEPSLCIDDISITPQASAPLHQLQRGRLSATRTLAPRKLRVFKNDLPSTLLPSVHHSVLTRFIETPDYRPISLRDTPFRLIYQDGSTSAPLHGISALQKLAHDLVITDATQ